MITTNEPEFELALLEALEFGALEFEALKAEARSIERKDLLNVRYLDCSNFDFSPEDYYILRKCSNLRSLDINVGGDLSFLRALPKLQSLWLTTRETGAIDLRSFSSLRDLYYLMISGGDLSGVDYLYPEGLIPLKKLETLKLHEFGRIDLSFLTKMPWLLHFFCGWPKQVMNVDAIGSLCHLKSLDLEDMEIEDFDFLGSLPYGTELTLIDIHSQKPLKKEKLRRFNCREISGVPFV